MKPFIFSWMSKNEDMKFTYTNTESRRAAALLRTMWEDGGGKIFRAGLITSLAHSAGSNFGDNAGRIS